jgi:deoxyribonuclease-4
MNARERGGVFPDADSYRRVFDAVANGLGDEKARFMHCHFSKIEYTDAGEKRHLTFEDGIYGPWFEPLAEALVKDGLCPRIISESAGTQTEDALFMQRAYEAAKQ